VAASVPPVPLAVTGVAVAVPAVAAVVVLPIHRPPALSSIQAPASIGLWAGLLSVTFTPNSPERGSVVLGSFDETLNVNGRWVAGRRLNGDETGNNTRWPSMGSFGIYHYTLFQRQ